MSSRWLLYVLILRRSNTKAQKIALLSITCKFWHRSNPSSAGSPTPMGNGTETMWCCNPTHERTCGRGGPKLTSYDSVVWYIGTGYKYLPVYSGWVVVQVCTANKVPVKLFMIPSWIPKSSLRWCVPPCPWCAHILTCRIGYDSGR